ncbi:hypothetical protein D3C78_1678160 [compost metagenome]
MVLEGAAEQVALQRVGQAGSAIQGQFAHGLSPVRFVLVKTIIGITLVTSNDLFRENPSML